MVRAILRLCLIRAQRRCGIRQPKAWLGKPLGRQTDGLTWLADERDHALLTVVIQRRLFTLRRRSRPEREPALGWTAGHQFRRPGATMGWDDHVLLAAKGCQVGPSAKAGRSRRS